MQHHYSQRTTRGEQLSLKYADPNYTEDGKVRYDQYFLHESDLHYEGPEYCWETCGCGHCYGADKHEHFIYEAYNQIKAYMEGLPLQSLLKEKLPPAAIDAAVAAAKAAEQEAETVPELPADLAERLKQHVESVFQAPYPVTAEMAEEVRLYVQGFMPSLKNIVIDHLSEEDLSWLMNACLFSFFWVRSPESWNPSRGKSLLEHLFAIYEIPEFLYTAWHKDPDRAAVKWMCWFIIMGQGGSLKKASRLFGWEFKKKWLPFLYTIPASFTPKEAECYLQVRVLGGNMEDCHMILPYFSRLQDVGSEAFVKETTAWLIRSRAAIEKEGQGELERVINWGIHLYTEGVGFSWRGRSWARFLAEVRAYYRRLEEARHLLLEGNLSWPPVGLSHSLIVEEKQWDFVELTSQQELNQEGLLLHHCVGRYAMKCLHGRIAIISVRKQGYRKLTIEYDHCSGKILQLRGKHNRRASNKECSIVEQWLNAIGAC